MLIVKSVLLNKEPSWQENRQGTRHRIPERVQSWIYESGSLTQRLRNGYGSGVAVKVLMQAWVTHYLSERKLLEQPEQRFCFIREVILHADGEPLILARTIIPAETIKFAHSNLSRLGARPLGEVIFACPKLDRIAMDLALIKLSAWTQAVSMTADINQPVWGRRTVYAIGHKHMLVCEFFLPAVLKQDCI